MSGGQQFILILVALLVIGLPVGLGLYDRLSGSNNNDNQKEEENGNSDHHHHRRR